MEIADRLYDCVALLENDMADTLDVDAAFSDQTRAARDARFSAEVVADISAFVRDGTAIPWAKIAAFALVAGAQRAHPALFPDTEPENEPPLITADLAEQEARMLDTY